jgi:hypothetical protein
MDIAVRLLKQVKWKKHCTVLTKKKRKMKNRFEIGSNVYVTWTRLL